MVVDFSDTKTNSYSDDESIRRKMLAVASEPPPFHRTNRNAHPGFTHSASMYNHHNRQPKKDDKLFKVNTYHNDVDRPQFDDKRFMNLANLELRRSSTDFRSNKGRRSSLEIYNALSEVFSEERKDDSFLPIPSPTSESNPSPVSKSN
eukprot:UN34310